MTWVGIVARYPEFASIEPDVEAILIQRNREVSRCFIVPIDAAYELVGLDSHVLEGLRRRPGSPSKRSPSTSRKCERAAGAK